MQLAFSEHPLWREIRIVTTTESTMADVASAAREGEAEGLVEIAEEQTAGRGRVDRAWESPARASAMLSMLLRPVPDPATWPLLPLLTGLAAVEAVSAVGQVEASLKWPNDVMVDGLKLGGILAERVDDAVVIGVGINVSTKQAELPVETATSLVLVGGSTDREILIREMLRAFARRYVAWRDTDGSADTVIPAYRERCETIGHQVDLHLPGGEVVRRFASSVDDTGRLVLRDEETGDERAVLVGDVTHVRKVK
jgi:BirA family biotin operon repressor/biotin-[acetyl-CoA-carboxylase] ligase